MSVCLSACLCLDVCLCLCIYVFVCLYVCFVYRSVWRWSVWRSVGLYVCLSLGQSVCGQSVYVPVCVPLSVYICLSICLPVCLPVCLSVCLLSVDRSSVFLNCRSVTVCTKRAGSGGEDAESQSGRLCTQERQTGVMNVELRTGACRKFPLRARS